MTDFIRKYIMIIDREKENGTLTDAVGEEMIEFPNMICGYLLKNELELKKDVYGIMIPIVMTQTERVERAEYEIGEAIRKLILRSHAAGESYQKIKESIQDIFSLSEAEAEEKMEKYWL